MNKDGQGTCEIKLFLALPIYPGGPAPVNVGAQLQLQADHPDWLIHRMELSLSLLTASFNTLWAKALDLRDAGAITHFLMLHADVKPRTPRWCDVLLGEMSRVQADVLSIIIPMKDERGLTSTAFDTHPWRPTRLTLMQAIHEHPETWTAEDLLFNTGLMLLDFRGEWVERICFTIRDRIVKNERGRWEAQVEPEDWNFSRQCRALGVKAWVTRAVVVDHYGFGRWPSDADRGWLTDAQNTPFAGAKA